MRPVVLVHGTWGRASEWYRPGGPLYNALGERGFEVYPFEWSGILAGLPNGLPGDPLYARFGGDDGELLPWFDAGEKLKLFCENHEGALDRPHVISHSHGLQVVTFAAAIGQPFQTVISLSGPIRRDMRRARLGALAGVRRWVQVVDPYTDDIIRDGELGDGEIGYTYDLDLPTATNIHVPGQGHSGMTTDVPTWDLLGLWQYLSD